MRALGPQSVSSFLKVALDVVYLVLCVAAAVIGPLGLAMMIYMPFAPGALHLTLGGRTYVSPLPTAAMAAVLMGLEAYVACLVVIVNRIRRVLETLMIGDPFRPQNVSRLRMIGAALVTLEASSYLLRMILTWTAPKSAAGGVEGWFHPTSLFAALVVFVLAEVFREGARLRREAELTI